MKNLDQRYWNQRYLSSNIGWDVGYVSTPIKEYVHQLGQKNLRVLIPGAGNAYEAEYLVELGFVNVYVCDWSILAIESAKEKMPNLSEKHFLQSDFFKLELEVDLILEQTFFCAFHPNKREEYVKKCYNILSNQGKLVGLFWNHVFEKEGPPYGGTMEEYLELFSDKFKIDELQTCYNSIKLRVNRELFAIFRKKGVAQH